MMSNILIFDNIIISSYATHLLRDTIVVLFLPFGPQVECHTGEYKSKRCEEEITV